VAAELEAALQALVPIEVFAPTALFTGTGATTEPCFAQEKRQNRTRLIKTVREAAIHTPLKNLWI
jgi:hypothetical protein